MSQAFVSSFAPVAITSSFTRSTTVSPRRQGGVTTPRMQLKTQERKTFSRTEENRRTKQESEYRGPQGFTPYAEKVNGRMAMLGFFIGLVTEIFLGVPINEQMLIMFSPLTHLIESVVRIAN